MSGGGRIGVAWGARGRRGGTRAYARALAVLALAGCRGPAEPRAQYLVTIATDAPVPQFGDRLVVELLDAHGGVACPACRNLFGLADDGAWPLSFGVTDTGGQVELRARLFRADHAGPDGLPAAGLTLDTLAVLPPADGVTPVHVTLSMACLGVAADLTERRACDPATGALAPAPRLAPDAGDVVLPQAGSWPPAATVPCPRPAPDAMACIEGGVFALGDPRFTPTSSTPGPDDDTPLPERLVRLSPYALDVDEFTVGAMRALVRAGRAAAPIAFLDDPARPEQACTYTDNEGAGERRPVNCVNRALAAAACAALGKRLPTEAEWEFAAVNRTRKTLFPWGDGGDYCARAVVGRGREVDLENQGPVQDESTACRAQGGMTLPWGPAQVGSTTDVTDQGVRDLGGNITEWVADAFAPYSDACWSTTALFLVDPSCARAAAGARSPLDARGGSWQSAGFQAHGFERVSILATSEGDPYLGFRCASDF